jgi:hypothetical protein
MIFLSLTPATEKWVLDVRDSEWKSLRDSESNWCPLFHLDSSRGLARQVVLHTTNPINLIHNPSRDPLQKLPIEAEDVRRHEIRRLHGSQRNHLLMHTLVSHDTDGLDGQQSRKRLADLVVQARSSDLFDEDVVCLSCDGYLLTGHLAQDTDSDSRTRERVAHHKVVGDA